MFATSCTCKQMGACFSPYFRREFIMVIGPSGVQFGLLSYEWLTKLNHLGAGVRFVSPIIECDYRQNCTTRRPVTNKSKMWQNLRKESRYRLYVFIKLATVNPSKCETTPHAHDVFCPLSQAWRVNCPFNCPITLSNYKHDAFTVL